MQQRHRSTSTISNACSIIAYIVAFLMTQMTMAAVEPSSCCIQHDRPGCEDSWCADDVCAEDAYCCEVQWDACCVNLAISLCSSLDGCHVTAPPGVCHAQSGPCCEANDTPGCEVLSCCHQVCMQDPFCCDVVWDAVCADLAMSLYCGCVGTPPQPVPPPAAFSCENHCGGAAPSGCWCDEACCHFGDCCVDKGEHCTGCQFGQGPPKFYGDWCKGTCDGLSDTGGCWCDESCVKYNDCCSTVCMDCPDLGICASNPADITGNGIVDGQDLLELLSNWGSCTYTRCAVMEPCHGDFNHDGEVDGIDLLFLLNNWG